MMASERPSKTVAVIGAGPYGLSVAAHLRRFPAVVLGETMESWRAMPARMFLKSVWSASSLADPDGRFSLDRYCDGPSRGREPIPLEMFIDYGHWFQRQAVREADPARVNRLG